MLGTGRNSFDGSCPTGMCPDFVLKVDQDLINQLSDLVDRFELLCVFGGDYMSSRCVSPGLFDRVLSHPALSDLGILVGTGVHFDVSEQALSRRGDSVRAGFFLLVSDDTGDGERFPVTTAARSLTGGSKCCGWLQLVMRSGACGSSNQRVVPSQGGGVECIWIVYTRQGSVEVLQVTGSLLLPFLLCCLIVVYLCEFCEE